jgi:hypothetical protein
MSTSFAERTPLVPETLGRKVIKAYERHLQIFDHGPGGLVEDADSARYIWRHRSESASEVRIDEKMRDTLDRVVATLHQLSRR